MQFTDSVVELKTKDTLTLFHYKDNVEHPSPYDTYRGVVIDSKGAAVSRAYPWCPEVVTSMLPTDTVFHPMYEGTIVRFYRYNGKPYIGTHRQIDISDGKSRIEGRRSFLDLIVDAISGWEYVEHDIDTAQGTMFEFTPSDWTELCVEGYCHVFILSDESIALSDHNTMYADYSDGPKLIHLLSWRVDGGMMKPSISMPYVMYDEPQGKSVGYHLHVPTMPTLTKEEGEHLLKQGGGVVGFSHDQPEYTTKYVSEEYGYKFNLVGETYNRIHRWHELMDESVDDANMLLQILPENEQSTHTKERMVSYYNDSIATVASFIAPHLLKRVNGQDSPFDRKFYTLIKKALTSAHHSLRTHRYRNLASATQCITTALKDIKYVHVYAASNMVLKKRKLI